MTREQRQEYNRLYYRIEAIVKKLEKNGCCFNCSECKKK